MSPEGGTPTQDCLGLARSQTVSQPCCAALGVDACGASLFCAAFDGRKQPTCYPEHSRKDLESCTEDRQCSSGGCNGAVGKCRSAPLTKCDPTAGCADDPAGRKYGCNGKSTPATCEPVGNGKTGDFCADAKDCDSQACNGQKCVCVPKCGGKTCGTDGCGGSCGVCPASAVCGGSTCACAPTLTSCPSGCVNVDSDPTNCGGCGKSCPSTASCALGSAPTNPPHRCQKAFFYPSGTKDCLQLCITNGYPRCVQQPIIGGCWVTAHTGGIDECPCEIDPM